ncbi:MAG: sensor histidine kinase [Lachnospiraceae bacterium]|nr:sensor histidine kinase [Lachnospiraceae bacterium]
MKEKLKELYNRTAGKAVYLGLRSKQLLFTLLCFLALVFFAFILLRTIYNSSMKSGLQNLESSLNSACSSLETETDQIYRNSIVMLRNADLKTLLQDRLSEEDIPGLISTKNQAVSFVRVLDENTFISGTRIYLRDNRTFLSDEDLFYSISEIEYEDWASDFLKGSRKSLWVVLPGNGAKDVPDSADSVFYLTRVVSTEEYDQTEALIRIDYSTEHVGQILNYALISKECGIALYEPEGGLIASSGDLFWDEETARGISGDAVSGKVMTENGQSLYYVRTIPDTGWKLVACVPESSFKALNKIRIFLPVLLVVAVSWAGLLLISASYSANIVRKIRKISDHVGAIQSENDVRLLPPFKSKDELQALVDSYNQMAVSLKENLEREYLLGMSKRSSDLKALQAQINPHFLYNTLELIDYYAYENDPETVEKIVKSLASFYKLSLNNGNDLYSLWKEIQLITSYMMIQNIRWESSIELVTEIPDELMQCQIPPFTLQPLIENSVLHGIRGNEKHRGTIIVRARKEEDTVIITVSDDGIGMEPELVDELNREMDMISEDTISGDHYGIQNSNQRLKIIFGPRYGMRVFSRPNEGTLVEIVIPAS